MRSLVPELPRLVGLVVVLQVVFCVLLVIGAAVPDRPIVERLSTDVATGSYGPSGEPDGQGGRATSFTDCVAAGTGLGGPNLSAFERAVRMPRLQSCEKGARQIDRLQRGEELGSGLAYFRYWAGYSVLTRPVLAAGGMDAMRLVAGGLFGMALIAMVLAVSRVTGVVYMLALTTPMLLSSNVLSVPATAFSHALSLAVIFGGVAAVASASRRAHAGAHGDRVPGERPSDPGRRPHDEHPHASQRRRLGHLPVPFHRSPGIRTSNGINIR